MMYYIGIAWEIAALAIIIAGVAAFWREWRASRCSCPTFDHVQARSFACTVHGRRARADWRKAIRDR